MREGVVDHQVVDVLLRDAFRSRREFLRAIKKGSGRPIETALQDEPFGVEQSILIRRQLGPDAVCRPSENLIELQKLLGLRSFKLADWRACLQAGTNAAWATDRGEPIVQEMLAHLRASNVLLPAAAVLERIGLAARVRARRRA
jgi:hypothetical protein